MTTTTRIVLDGSTMDSGRRQGAWVEKTFGKGGIGLPGDLAAIPSPPEVLYIKGNLPPGPRVALVGARKADDYGRRISYNLSKDLANAGVCVVNGGALGVDTAAIEGCLAGGGRPVVVQGTGLDITYPAKNKNLFNEVAQKGALVSEYAPGTPGIPARFAMRNRIISGLSVAVVVVQATLGSGSLITANFALKQNRKLMAIPGMIDNPLSSGTNQLIRKGALLVEKASDVLSVLGMSIARQPSLGLVENQPELSREESTVLAVLGSGSFSIDTLCERMRCSSSHLNVLLLEMELKGLVTKKPGMIYCRKSNIDSTSA